jgi:hypothetical protein
MLRKEAKKTMFLKIECVYVKKAGAKDDVS